MRFNVEVVGEDPIRLGKLNDDTVQSEAAAAVREKFTAGLRGVLGDING